MLNLPDIQPGQDDLRHKGSWLNALKREVQRLGKMTGDGNILVSDDAGGIAIRWNGIKGSGSPSSISSYTGPWAVVRKNDTTVTIKAQGDGYPCISRVIAGLITTVHSTDADVTITVDGEVYLHVTVSGATYTLAFANAATLPAQTAGNYYVSLARVESANSKIGTITQIKTSDIEITGRVV